MQTGAIRKLGQAMKFINNEDQTLGVHPLNEMIKGLLAQKHPNAEPADEEVLIEQHTDMNRYQ